MKSWSCVHAASDLPQIDSGANVLLCCACSAAANVDFRYRLACVIRANSVGMRRLTVQVRDEMHRALKMVSLMEGKSLGRVVVEAIDAYLKQRGAYEFDIVRKADP